jgi:hypothetical protein
METTLPSNKTIKVSQPYHQPAQPASPGRDALCILVQPGQPELAERLNQTIAELEDEDIMQQFEEEYLAAP